MKITKSYLKQLIKEEIENLNESRLNIEEPSATIMPSNIQPKNKISDASIALRNLMKALRSGNTEEMSRLYNEYIRANPGFLKECENEVN